MLIVDANSASPQLPGVVYYGIEATHSQMCKFASSNAPGFRTLSTDIRCWVQEAPGVIQGRWVLEERETQVREFHERMCQQVGTHTLEVLSYSESPHTDRL
jgi:hypothetical protein